MTTKLLIRHLPSFFTPEDTKSFLRSFGSIDVHTFDAKGKMKYCAFATFPDELSCSFALRNLHQLQIGNTRLVVEFAKDAASSHSSQSDPLQFDKEHFFSQLHVISSKFRINHPISPLLRYRYPPASAPILRNITKALANCPPFYTQVLHLMNKMNLPPPFINTDYEFDEQHLPKSFDCKVVDLNSETSESELDEPADARPKVHDTRQADPLRKKRVVRERIKEASKRLKVGSEDSNRPTSSTGQSVSSTIQPPIDQKSVHQKDQQVVEYFDEYASLKRMQIRGKVKLKKEQSKKSGEQQVALGFGTFTSHPSTIQKASDTHREGQNVVQQEDVQSEVQAKESNPKDPANSQTEDPTTSDPVLFKRQLTPEELNDHPVFRDYVIGEPSCRLYVKNVDKHVTEQRLASVYMRLLGLSSDSELNVTVFKKGKMNGQAFVSLPSEQMALEAIHKSHGLLLDKKPIVVCFARSIKAKE